MSGQGKDSRGIVTKERLTVRLVLMVLVCITLYGIVLLIKEPLDYAQALHDFLYYAGSAFLQPRLASRTEVWDIVAALGFTLALAALTTLIGAAAAFFLAIGAARNLSHPFIASTISVMTALIRSIPTIIWVLVFSITADIGTDAAVLGMAVHSIAYLVKGFSETFEHIEQGSIEALQSCGAGFPSVIMQAVIPSSRSSLLSWIFFRFEINFVNAVAVGAAAGSGGIGYHLFMAGNLYFDIHEIGVFTYMIFTTAFVLELISVRIKNSSVK